MRSDKTPFSSPRLFYYEEAVGGYVPVPNLVENLVDVDSQLTDGETLEVVFKRIDMTDKEFDELPDE